MNLSEDGFLLRQINLPQGIRAIVERRDWPALDREVREFTLPGGAVFEELRPFAEFTEIEFIISIRSSLEFPDDDGIWHDDGSRVLAFSMSLTLEPGAIEGGQLEIRRQSQPAPVSKFIPTPDFGTMIVFATGHLGFEHKINKVTQGERIIIAGWCT